MSRIARLYNDPETATAAAAACTKRGFGTEPVVFAAAPTGSATQDGAAPSADAVRASIAKAGIGPAQAAVFADRVLRGEALLVVEAPFGMSYVATGILDSFHPIAVELPAPESVPAPVPPVSGYGPTPFSTALGWRVLSSDPTPLSTFLKWPTLKPAPARSAILSKIRRQSANPAPFSRMLGWRLLSGNPAPLSSRLGWRLLWGDAAPLSKKLGWRLLSDKPFPLSTMLGWRLLLHNPTPLSSFLGWRVLSKR